MKKTVIICLLVLLLSLCGCSGDPSNRHIEDPTEEPSYSIGYDDGHMDGYDEGYKDGIKYALSVLRDGAYDWPVYMDIEDIDASIHDYMVAYHSDEDCCDVRDMIIYSDYEHHTLEELLDELVAENINEPAS